MSWDSALYTFANDCMEKSGEKWKAKEYGPSWGYSIPARLAYLADLIVNLIQFPFAIIGITFGSLHALVTLNYQSPLFQESKSFIIEKTNHALLSIFGAVVSPALAHRYQNANLAPFVIAARITVLSGGLLYYVFS